MSSVTPSVTLPDALRARRPAWSALLLGSDPAGAEASKGRSFRILLRLGLLAIAGQLLLLLAYSFFLYHRFTLGIDFGIYNQAATQISHGNLNPYSTISGSLVGGNPFIKSHFELIIWPISALLLIFRTSYILLAVQDLAAVGTGAVVLVWAAAFLSRRSISTRAASAILIGVTVLLLVNPLVYYTAAIDFHTEALSTLFAVLAAFDIWSGRPRRALVWVALCLLCGDVGALYVIGVGLSATIAPGNRRLGVIVMSVGGGWLALISGLGANLGSHVAMQYGYLAGRAALPAGIGGAFVLLGGLFTHTYKWSDILAGRLTPIGEYLLPGGVIGLLAPWGFGVPILVLLSSALQGTPLFIVDEPFQQFAVFPFVLFGTVCILTYLIENHTPALAGKEWWSNAGVPKRIVAALTTPLLLSGVVFYSSAKLPHAFTDNAVDGFVPGNEAAMLRQVLPQIPADAEVISSLPISGRLSGHKYVYLYLSTSQRIPVHAKTVVLVMDTFHALQFVSLPHLTAAGHFVTNQFGARTLAFGSDLWVLKWSAPSGSSAVVLP